MVNPRKLATMSCYRRFTNPVWLLRHLMQWRTMMKAWIMMRRSLNFRRDVITWMSNLNKTRNLNYNRSMIHSSTILIQLLAWIASVKFRKDILSRKVIKHGRVTRTIPTVAKHAGQNSCSKTLRSWWRTIKNAKTCCA